MTGNTVEALIGGAVLAVAGGFLLYATDTATLSSGGGYELTAQFRKAEGIAPGGDVRIGGVKVGTITGMTLDPQTYKAVVRLTVDDAIRLPDDSDVKITSSGLLSDNHLAITPGASDFMLESGDELQFTQDSVNLTDMVGRFIHGVGE